MNRSDSQLGAGPLPDLFPPIQPFGRGMLPVDQIHSIYWEQCGNPQGAPVLFVHGGPGGGITEAHRRFFDPAFYRVVLFDQRGAGRSTPIAGIQDNTTAHLIDDMEALRRHLGIERWLLFGGSWGSTLSIAYGQAHPERCIGFILRGVFLFRPVEVDWFLHGMRMFFPEAAERFLSFLPEPERADPLGSYHRRLIDPDPAVHMPAAASWVAYEESCSRLIPRGSGEPRTGDSATLALARLEAHYMVNQGFLRPDELLSRMALLSGHPAIIVQGRYDMVCPPVTARDLARAWTSAELISVADAGHSALEAGIRSQLVASTQRFKVLYRS